MEMPREAFFLRVLERQVRVGEQTHSNARGLRAQRALKAIPQHLDSQRTTGRCHVEAAVREFMEMPKATLVCSRQFAQVVEDIALDFERSAPKVSRKRFK